MLRRWKLLKSLEAQAVAFSKGQQSEGEVAWVGRCVLEISSGESSGVLVVSGADLMTP